MNLFEKSLKETDIRVITLWEPWATLLAYGLKQNETRPKPTKHTADKGIYLIHAAKKSKKYIAAMCHLNDYVRTALESIEIYNYYDLNFGKVIGAFEVKECQMVNVKTPHVAMTNDYHFKCPELCLGDYSVKRSIWIGQNHRLIEKPFEYDGGQGYYRKFTGDVELLKFKK